VQDHLRRAGNDKPDIRLISVPMKRLDDARMSLGIVCLHDFRERVLAELHHLAKKAAVVRKNFDLFYLDVIDHMLCDKNFPCVFPS